MRRAQSPLVLVLPFARPAPAATAARASDPDFDFWLGSTLSRALGKLGVPGRDEMEALVSRVEELSKAVKKLNPQAAAPAAAKKAAAKKAPAKKAASKAK